MTAAVVPMLHAPHSESLEYRLLFWHARGNRKKLRPALLGLAVLSNLLPGICAQAAGGSTLPSLSADYGAVGLIGEMNSAEHYGAVQSRLGAYNATVAGDAHLTTLVAPLNVIVSLPQDGKWLVKVGSAYVHSSGAYAGGDMPDSTNRNYLLQMLHRPAAGTLLGLGVVPENTDISIAATNAGIGARGTGLRFDVLQRIGSRSGFSAKLIHLDGRSTFSRTLPNGQRLSVRSSTARTYAEVTFTTILDNARQNWVPSGWSLRPVTHILVQRDHDKAEQGAASTDYFAQWLLTARLQKDVFRAGQAGPYIELGTEHELLNDYATAGNNELLLYGKMGMALLAGGWGRLDVYYARRQSPDEDFTSNTLNLLLSMAF